MALTESKIKDLRDKKFDKLFDKHQEEWLATTENAFITARDHICGGSKPRQDDVLKMLMPMLEPNETLRKHQEEHHARYKHYREAFGEYLIDHYFTRLDEEEQENERRTKAGNR